jgi:hypothetical protein
MSRVIETLQAVLLSDTVIGWIDTLLLCLGLTCTIASAVPALQSIRARGARR